MCVFSPATKNNIITPNLLSFKSVKERAIVFTLHADVKHSVFCFRKLLQTNTSEKIFTWAASFCKNRPQYSNSSFFQLIILTFDVLIQSSFLGGNTQQRLQDTLTGWIDGYETDFLFYFPAANTKPSSGFTATVQSMTQSLKPPSIRGDIYQYAIHYYYITVMDVFLLECIHLSSPHHVGFRLTSASAKIHVSAFV